MLACRGRARPKCLTAIPVWPWRHQNPGLLLECNTEEESQRGGNAMKYASVAWLGVVSLVHAGPAFALTISNIDAKAHTVTVTEGGKANKLTIDSRRRPRRLVPTAARSSSRMARNTSLKAKRASPSRTTPSSSTPRLTPMSRTCPISIRTMFRMSPKRTTIAGTTTATIPMPTPPHRHRNELSATVRPQAEIFAAGSRHSPLPRGRAASPPVRNRGAHKSARRAH